MNFYNTLFVISTENCGEFLIQLFVIFMVDYGEFHRGLMSVKIGWCIVINFYNKLSVVLTLDRGEFLQNTLCNFDGR